MFPNFVIKACTLSFGYVYPGYKCFKALQKRRPDVKELVFWCRFWVLLAVITTAEFFVDPLLSWIPMYSELKLALVVFLWHPNTLGADYLYDRFLLPLLARYESTIDVHLKEAQEQLQEVAVHLWRQACMYAQVQSMELISYLYSLSTEAARQAYLERDRGDWSHREVREVNDLDDRREYTFVGRPVGAEGGVQLQEVDVNGEPIPSSPVKARAAADVKEEAEDSDTPISRLRPRRRSAARQ